MQFDHLEKKEFLISEWVRQSLDYEILFQEIEKQTSEQTTSKLALKKKYRCCCLFFFVLSTMKLLRVIFKNESKLILIPD